MMKRCGWMGAALVLVLLCNLQISKAHEIRPTIFTLTLGENGSVKLAADLNLEALLADIGAEHDDTSQSPNAQIYENLREQPPAELEKAFRAFAPRWVSVLGIKVDGEPLTFRITFVDIPAVGDTALARQSMVFLEDTLPPGAQNITFAYPAQFGASVLRIHKPGQEVDARFLQPGAESGPLSLGIANTQSTWQVFSSFVVVGFEHILPKGLDHILFVLGLFLLNQHWKPLLWQVTAFTIAHSVTLALGLYGLVQLSPSIVEPLIALSIVYVAVENVLTDRLHPWRPFIVFAFGLLHGLGFAGILTEIGLAPQHYVTGLIAFNIGVELGQIAVIAVAFAALAPFMGKAWYRRGIVWPASIAIALMGAFWFLERTVL